MLNSQKIVINGIEQEFCSKCRRRIETQFINPLKNEIICQYCQKILSSYNSDGKSNDISFELQMQIFKFGLTQKFNTVLHGSLTMKEFVEDLIDQFGLFSVKFFCILPQPDWNFILNNKIWLQYLSEEEKIQLAAISIQILD